MIAALVSVGDRYRAPDGVRYSLIEESALDLPGGEGRLGAMRSSEPIVEEVLRFEVLALGSAGTRRAIVRWSDGTESAALTFYGDLCGRPHKSPYAEV
jgi:hypothetical protein